MSHLCLVVTPIGETARRLERELPLFGIRPHPVDTFAAALTLLQQWRFETVLLDADGFGERSIEAVRRLRRRSRVPVVLLANTPPESVQLSWFEAGASDVVQGPVSTPLLAARLRRLTDADARPHAMPSALSVGPLAMDPGRATASVDGRPLALTPHQFELLYMLALRLGQFVHREAIARALRTPGAVLSRSADVHIYRIRRKLREMGVTSLRLDTVHGRGYCLSTELVLDTDDPQVDAMGIDADRPFAGHPSSRLPVDA